MILKFGIGAIVERLSEWGVTEVRDRAIEREERGGRCVCEEH